MKDRKAIIVSVYLDEITIQRLKALSAEMTLSRSSILRMLVAEKWAQRHEQFLDVVERFDEAKSRREEALMQGVDPLDAPTLARQET